MPDLVLLIAWIVVGAYSAYRVFTMISGRSKPWFQILFFIAVFIIALSFVLPKI